MLTILRQAQASLEEGESRSEPLSLILTLIRTLLSVCLPNFSLHTGTVDESLLQKLKHRLENKLDMAFFQALGSGDPREEKTIQVIFARGEEPFSSNSLQGP